LTTNSYAELVAEVRRFRPQDLLPALAALSARNFQVLLETDFDALEAARRSAPVWTLAELARISISRGNDYRRPASLGARQLNRLVDLDVNLEPVLPSPEGNLAAALAYPLMRLASDQFTHQVNPKFDMARALACFSETQPDEANRRLPPGWEERVLGFPLIDYLQTGFVAHLVAATNDGSIPATVAEHAANGIPEGVLPRNYLKILDQCYTMDYTERPSGSNGNRQSGPLERYSFNPLWDRPVLKNVPDIPGFLVPVPHLVARKLSLTSIFFAGMRSDIGNFGGLLGYHFEAYVGANLRLIPGVEVLSEISYISQGSAAKTVDFIVVFPGECVVLVEVKAARPSETLRSGGPDAPELFTKVLGRGIEQIDRTAALISSASPALSHVPANLPILGILVTGDAFPLVNSVPVRAWYMEKAATDCLVASIAELEHFAAMPRGHGKILRKAFTDPSGGLTGAMTPSDFVENPLIQGAFQGISSVLRH